MNANAIFTFLGLVAFLFVVLFTLATEGVILASASLAILLVIAFVIALIVYLIATRYG